LITESIPVVEFQADVVGCERCCFVTCTAVVHGAGH